MVLKMHESLNMPAGVWLKEAFIAPENISLKNLSERLSVSRQALSAVLNGRSSLTSCLAVRLEKILGVSANMLMSMQVNYEMSQAREKERQFVAKPLHQFEGLHA